MNYPKFKIGDLVQVEYGDRPLGIVMGHALRRYGENALGSRGSYSINGEYVSRSYELDKGINYFQYPVMIQDAEELFKNRHFYHSCFRYPPDTFNSFLSHRFKNDMDFFTPQIHPLYLTFIASGD